MSEKKPTKRRVSISVEELKEKELPGIVASTQSDFSDNSPRAYVNLRSIRRLKSITATFAEAPENSIPTKNIDDMQLDEEPEATDIATQSIKRFTKLKDFIESLPSKQRRKSPQDLLEIYGIPLEVTNSIRTNSLIHNIVTTIKTGTALLRGRAFYPKSFPVKNKMNKHEISINSPFYQEQFNSRPLLQGIMPLSQRLLGKIDPETRRTAKIDQSTGEKKELENITAQDLKKLKEKDPAIDVLHFSFTPLEILRSIQHGDIKIDRIERDKDGQLSKMILKYKEGYGPLEFEEEQGKIIIDLKSSQRERKPQYQSLSSLDEERKRDRQVEQNISKIVRIQTGLIEEEINEVTNFLTTNLYKDYKVYTKLGEKEQEPLHVLGRKLEDSNELIPFGGDVDLQSFTISKDLYEALEGEEEYLKYLYEPINIIPSVKTATDNLEQKRDLLRKTTKLLQKLEPYYFKKITIILENLNAEINKITTEIQEIQEIQEKINKNPEKDKQQLQELNQRLLLLKQQLLPLRQQKDSIENSEFYKTLKHRNNIRNPPTAQITEKWWQKLFKFKKSKQVAPSNSPLEPIKLDILFNNDEDKQEYFTNFVGNVTPIQFLDKTIMNYFGQAEFFQHGADQFGIGNTFALDTGTHEHVFGDNIFSTTTEQERVALWLTEEIFDNHYIHVHSTVDMRIWAPLIERQLTSRYKDMVDKTTEEQYFKYLFQDDYKNLKLLLTNIDGNEFLNTEQKKDLLEKIILKIDNNNEDSSEEILIKINTKIMLLNMQLQQNNIRRGLAKRMMDLVPKFTQRTPATSATSTNMLNLTGRTSPYNSPRNSSGYGSPRASTYETSPQTATQETTRNNRRTRT